MSVALHYALVAAVIGAFAGKRIGWAIRAWPGHEKFHCDYLYCGDCEGGKRRGCYNAGRTQDRLYILFSALVAGLSVAFWGVSTKAFLSWLFSAGCLIITVVDIRYLIIPDTLSINGCWTGLLYSAACWGWIKYGFAQPSYYVEFSDALIGFVLGGGFLWLLAWLAVLLLKKEGMGGGDVKLLAAFGAWSGWQTVIATVIIASFIGSVGGIGSILYNKIRYRKEYRPLTHMIPFGPYLCFGFLFVFYLGLDPLLQLLDAYQLWLYSTMP
ncbi:MAG: A24 family peptidase [Candidatus Riflebacteria bacterium]|nr:A24 family peptidase [Candidatus Riflebacteria bacterium]